MIIQDGFGYSEREKELNWAAAYAKRELTKHKEAATIDHPDGSVTEEKLADGSISERTIRDNAVTSDKLKDGSVTEEKLGSDISGKFDGLTEDISKLTERIKNEEDWSTQKVKDLNDRIDEEINNEYEARSQEDEQLWTEIRSEGNLRQSADEDLSERITAETTARTEAGAELSNSITTLEGDVSGLDSEVNSLSNRIDTAEANIISLEDADKALSSSISSLEADVANLLKEVTMNSPMSYSEKLSSDCKSYIVDVNIGAYTIFAYGTRCQSAGYSAPAAFTPSVSGDYGISEGYVYAAVTFSPSGHISSEEAEISSAGNLTGITIQSDGDYKVMWLVGKGYYEIEGDPDDPNAAPSRHYNFTQTENRARITFYSENGLYRQLEAEATERTTADTALDGKIKAVKDAVGLSTTNHEIHVQCDGDHDELKLQSAIDNAPQNSVIYPVGTCVITNDNIQMGVGGMADTGGAVINLKEKCTLDGRYCHSMTFVNSNPQTSQIIFLMQVNTKIKNLEFSEDLDTTATPPQPTLIYSKGTCEISNCNFSEISDTGVSNIPMIYVTGKNNIFKNNIFSNIYFTAESRTSPPIEIEADVIGNTFDGGYCTNNDGNSSNSTMIRFKGPVYNNRFSKFELSGGKIQFHSSTKEGVSGNKFSNLKDVQFDFWCSNINENIFASCNINIEYGVLIMLNGSLSNPILFSNNTLSALRAAVDNVILISIANEHCRVSNNYIAISQAVGITTGIDAVGKSQIQNNTIKLIQFAANSTTLDVCKGLNGAIFADNITNATSLGIFDETCVVERNITAEVSA